MTASSLYPLVTFKYQDCATGSIPDCRKWLMCFDEMMSLHTLFLRLTEPHIFQKFDRKSA